MMFLICDFNFENKYYLSYVGCSANDYLGITGAPVGSNHLFYNATDSALYLGTTTHSSHTTQIPKFVGRGPADFDNIGVPVFDETKGNGNNDTHVIIALSMRNLFIMLPLDFTDMQTSVLADCSTKIAWTMAGEESVLRYLIQRSTDGRMFETIGEQTRINKVYSFVDKNNMPDGNWAYYRVAAETSNGKISYSNIHKIKSCSNQSGVVSIFPTAVQNSFTISGLANNQKGNISVDLVDVSGKTLEQHPVNTLYSQHSVFLQKKYPDGVYFIVARHSDTGAILFSKKILIANN
jgi:hypothetical protein